MLLADVHTLQVIFMIIVPDGFVCLKDSSVIVGLNTSFIYLLDATGAKKQVLKIIPAQKGLQIYDAS